MIVCDVTTGAPRPFIPKQFRRKVFDSLYSLSHPGIRATQKLVTDRYVWPNINSDVRKWARSCLSCRSSKIQRHTKSPPSTFATPDARFNQVHIDIVGPLPSSNGFSYILTCIDCFTHGLKLFHSLILLLKLLLAHSFIPGYLNLVFLLQLPQTEVASLNQPCGTSSCSYLDVRASALLPITLPPMGS